MRITWLKIFLVTVAASLTACGGEQSSSSGDVPNPSPGVLVETVVAQSKPVAQIVESVGTLLGDESVTLTAKVTEQVIAVYFEGGEFVEQGQVLAELKDVEQRALLAEAEANLWEAQLKLNRLVSLGSEVATAAQIDVARAMVDAEKAQVNAIRSRIDDRRITAPFSGVVGIRQISVGALLSPGTVIAELDTIDPLKLEFTLPEKFISQVAVGDEVTGRSIAWPDHHFIGTVQQIGSRIDPVSRAFPVRALLDNESGRLRPGMLINVSLAMEQGAAVTVPESALLQVGAYSSVYVVDADGKARKRDVELGRRLPGEIVLLSGVEAGEDVVVNGQLLLRPGIAVRRTPAASGEME